MAALRGNGLWFVPFFHFMSRDEIFPFIASTFICTNMSRSRKVNDSDVHKEAFSSLLRAALWGKAPDASLYAGADWRALFRMADIQTVLPLMLDGIALLPKEVHPPLPLKLKAIGMMQRVEESNRLHRTVIIKIHEALKADGIDCVFMKGQIAGLKYPQPLHRQPGDIDFVVRKEDFPRTLRILESIGKVDYELVHEHHGMAWVDGVTVEPHYKVHNFQRPATDRAMRAMFDEVFPDGLVVENMDGHGVPAFPPSFESVFLISHMVNHVYEEGLGLRQVVDYALFLSRHGQDLDRNLHAAYLKRMRMERSWRIFTCLCTETLGASRPEWVTPFSPQERVWAVRLLDDILRMGNFGRGAYIFSHNGWKDALRNYGWVVERCRKMGFVCPDEARWWIVSKAFRFLWKLFVRNGKT